MKHKPFQHKPFFFSTAPLPCPYLPGRIERRVVTELVGRDADVLHDALSRAGFRRSHGIAYAPACPTCSECRAVRIVVDEFTASRTQKRIARRNFDLDASEVQALATEEQFDLFAAYQKYRHGDGDMARMGFLDYQALVEDSPVNTALIEYRNKDDHLVAACLTDTMSDGLSAVYSFFDASLGPRSLGTFMILWLVDRARQLGLQYVYLGYWIAGCGKMSYKEHFRPLEVFTPAGWKNLEDVRNAEDMADFSLGPGR